MSDKNKYQFVREILTKDESEITEADVTRTARKVGIQLNIAISKTEDRIVEIEDQERFILGGIKKNNVDFHALVELDRDKERAQDYLARLNKLGKIILS